MSDEFEGICDAYALSQRQAEVLRALVLSGAIHTAARSLEIPYTAARNTVAELKLKLGVATVPMMIALALDLVAEDFGDKSGRLRRHDVFSLSERQYAIARNIGIAKTRAEIAETLRISEAVIDAELKDMYLILGVRSAGELVAVIARSGLGAPDDAVARIASLDVAHELPVASIMRDGRHIGYSDFGPASGVPVLILHSTITSRPPPTRLVAALQRQGFRPIAIDRPGFGDSDMAAGDDPYVAAADDVAALCAALGLAGVAVVARGSGQAAVRLAQRHPGLVDRAILVNPSPVHYRHDSRSRPAGRRQARLCPSPLGDLRR